MKATVLTSAIVLCALTAFAAGQQQQTAPAEKPAAKSTVPEQTLSATPAQSNQQDSPLVAAAKRTGRLGKKPKDVITNDTLMKSGGHFTTTKSQDQLPAEAKQDKAKNAANQPLTTNNAPSATAAASTPAPAAKKAEEKKPASNAARRAAAAYEGDSVDSVTEDPATQEGVMAGGGARKPEAAPKPAAPKPPTN